MHKPKFLKKFLLAPLTRGREGVPLLTGLDLNENVSTWRFFFPFNPEFLHLGKGELVGGIFV